MPKKEQPVVQALNFDSTLVASILYNLGPDGENFTLSGENYVRLRCEPVSQKVSVSHLDLINSFIPTDPAGKWLLCRSLENLTAETETVVQRIGRMALNAAFPKGAGTYFEYTAPGESRVDIENLTETTALFLKEDPGYIQRTISHTVIPGTMMGLLPYRSNESTYEMLRSISKPEIASNPDSEAERKSLWLYEHIVVNGKSIDRESPDHPAFRLILAISKLSTYARNAPLGHFLTEMQTLSAYAQVMFDPASVVSTTFIELGLRTGEVNRRLTAMSDEASRLLNLMRHGHLVYHEALELLSALNRLQSNQTLYVISLAAYMLHTQSKKLLESQTCSQILESVLFSTQVKQAYLGRKSRPETV